MKKKNFNQKFNLVPTGIFFVLIFAGIISCTGQKTNDKVYEAYELRINGHADSAQILLEQITSENPGNALAWYELSRTTQQLGMANPREIKDPLDEALRCISLAVENDPDNALYLSYKGGIETLHFYMGMQMGNENAAEYLEKVEKTYNSVFQLDPSYYENKLTLVEFFGGLPEDMGGDPEKAEKYAGELEKADLVYGAKARELLMPEDADYKTFWKEIIEKDPENAEAYYLICVSHGRQGDFEKAVESGTKALEYEEDDTGKKARIYYEVGNAYVSLVEYDKACAAFKNCLVEPYTASVKHQMDSVLKCQ